MGSETEVEDYSRRLAEAIKARREASNLSKNRLSELSALSQPMIGLIERNIHSPTVETLYRISKSMETTPAKLLAEIEGLPEKPKPAKARTTGLTTKEKK